MNTIPLFLFVILIVEIYAQGIPILTMISDGDCPFRRQPPYGISSEFVRAWRFGLGDSQQDERLA